MRQLLRIREDRVPRGWAVGQRDERETRLAAGRGNTQFARKNDKIIVASAREQCGVSIVSTGALRRRQKLATDERE